MYSPNLTGEEDVQKIKRIAVYLGSESDSRVVETMQSAVEGVRALEGFEHRVIQFPSGTKHFKIEPKEDEIAIIWGITSIKFGATTFYRDLVREAYPGRTICIERGHVRRHSYYSIGWDDIQNAGAYYNEGSPSDRWEALGVPLQDVRKKGDYVLFCRQLAHDTSVQFLQNYEGFAKGFIERLIHTEECPVKVRWHPLDFRQKTRPLEEDLKGARKVFGVTSTALVESQIAGCPTFPLSHRSMAFLDDLSREQWAYNLAYTQWDTDEIETGYPFKRLIEKRFGL